MVEVDAPSDPDAARKAVGRCRIWDVLRALHEFETEGDPQPGSDCTVEVTIYPKVLSGARPTTISEVLEAAMTIEDRLRRWPVASLA